MLELEGRDEQGYKYRYYTRSDDQEHKPVFWKRKDYPDVVYRTEEAKLRAIALEILRYHVQGRPLLVGTTSVELSEHVSNRLRSEPLRRLALVQLLRSSWMDNHNREEDGRQIPELQFLNESLEKLDISEMRKLARELAISFNPEDGANIERLTSILELASEDKERLVSVFQAGIPHEVLNARKHTEESQIIAGAGSYGAVTIATNMAGRGVDIKLGGELAEEILASVNRVLRRGGQDDPYDMTMEKRREALLQMDLAEFSIYESEVNYYLQHMKDMERVRQLGGLHVIGSERHEARRIDNQLRGRAARQGDPGSSRFYLSMEDELMRLFGGQQADNLMQRLKIDDALPLEVGLVSRIVEQSQTRVEGANFDVRKHLLEYDDVLNTQRSKIYAQRNRVFTKDDLSEDVTDMLRTEVTQRVPEALKDEEGPWKLLAWLEQIQPPLTIDGSIFPSFSMRLLVDHIWQTASGGDPNGSISSEAAKAALLNVAQESLKAEEQRLLTTVNALLNQTQDRLESQVNERMETLDTFIEGLSLEDETGNRRPADIINELSNAVHLPLKLTSEQQRSLKEDPEQVADEIRDQVENTLVTQAITRLVGSVERRLEDSLDIPGNQFDEVDWDTLADAILNAIEAVFDRRIERYLGEQGQITKDIENALARLDGEVTRDHLRRLLIMIPQGARAMFDKRTHRRVWQRTVRLTYVYFAALALENQDPDEIASQVLEHLEAAQSAMRKAWGQAEASRIGASSMADLDEKSRLGLENFLGEEHYQQLASQPFNQLDRPDWEEIVDELGRQALTAIYRQLILSVVTELWVDYLTQMEALRVSIGLEAYAQRDPLVQYKNRAFELFQNLLSDMRMGVVTRMFTYQPRDISSVQSTVTRSEPAQLEERTEMEEENLSDEEAELVEESTMPAVESPPKGMDQKKSTPVSKKRRRRRH